MGFFSSKESNAVVQNTLLSAILELLRPAIFMMEIETDTNPELLIDNSPRGETFRHYLTLATACLYKIEGGNAIALESPSNDWETRGSVLGVDALEYCQKAGNFIAHKPTVDMDADDLWYELSNAKIKDLPEVENMIIKKLETGFIQRGYMHMEFDEEFNPVTTPEINPIKTKKTMGMK